MFTEQQNMNDENVPIVRCRDIGCINTITVGGGSNVLETWSRFGKVSVMEVVDQNKEVAGTNLSWPYLVTIYYRMTVLDVGMIYL